MATPSLTNLNAKNEFLGSIFSPIKGGDGNIEYLAIFTKNQTDKNIDRAKIHALLKNEGRG